MAKSERGAVTIMASMSARETPRSRSAGRMTSLIRVGTQVLSASTFSVEPGSDQSE